ncbi:GGDEF domain-containing protein [Stappia sp.]|uniref:GGDEF domain-containing protein n=1 Tax=Stappia sp. TaxID=1870903 RepID=UPI0032D908A0
MNGLIARARMRWQALPSPFRRGVRRTAVIVAGSVLSSALATAILFRHLSGDRYNDALLAGTLIPLVLATLFSGVWLRDYLLIHRLAEENAALAARDELTGVANRRAFFEWLDSRRDGPESIALFLIDIDHFKRINDRFGHLNGDAALRAVVDRLRAVAPETGCLARFGGEEFIFALPCARGQDCWDDAMAWAEGFRRSVAAEPLRLDGSALDVTVSVGVHLTTPPEALKSALYHTDVALYAAKAAGRNCVIASRDVRDVVS